MCFKHQAKRIVGRSQKNRQSEVKPKKPVRAKEATSKPKSRKGKEARKRKSEERKKERAFDYLRCQGVQLLTR